MVLELRDKLEIAGLAVPASAAPPAGALTALEQDVLSALVNLGCARPAAELAVRKARAAGAPVEFEPFFRKALALVR
jgi:Holliday junction DNA helicase RuvA